MAKNKTGKWVEDVNKIGIFQTVNYVYDDNSGNGFVSGPSNLQAAVGALIGIGIFVLLLIF